MTEQEFYEELGRAFEMSLLQGKSIESFDYRFNGEFLKRFQELVHDKLPKSP